MLLATPKLGLPVLLTLNGGIWADASCDVPAWDINDQLEQNVANCQWNEKNQVMPDDARKDLPGSQHAPELGRSLTWDAEKQQVAGDEQANKLLRRPYRRPWVHPEA